MTRRLSEDAAAELGERLQEERREAAAEPCRCRDCGPAPFEMRAARLADQPVVLDVTDTFERALDVERGVAA